MQQSISHVATSSEEASHQFPMVPELRQIPPLIHKNDFVAATREEVSHAPLATIDEKKQVAFAISSKEGKDSTSSDEATSTASSQAAISNHSEDWKSGPVATGNENLAYRIYTGHDDGTEWWGDKMRNRNIIVPPSPESIPLSSERYNNSITYYYL